jgi:hypothetical protein
MQSWSRFLERPLAAGEGSAGPGTHALVIGVSAYDNLPEPEAARTEPWGLLQLDSAATAAVLFAEWLVDKYKSGEEAPLRSLRVLLSPYAPTEADWLGERIGDAPPATRANVKTAIQSWAADLEARAPEDEEAARRRSYANEPTGGNTSLLYVAGHGTYTGLVQRNLLLQDLSPGLDLDGSLNLTNVLASLTHLGLDASYAFVDTCMDWLAPGRAYGGNGAELSHEYSHRDLRRADLRIYAAMRGEVAYGQAEFGSAFGYTLREQLSSAVESTSGGAWGVTPQKLASRLGALVHPEQHTWPEPRGGKKLRFQLPERDPKGTIKVTLAPPDGRRGYEVAVLDDDFRPECEVAPFEDHPHTLAVDPGTHIVELTSLVGGPTMRKSRTVEVYEEMEYDFMDAAG